MGSEEDITCCPPPGPPPLLSENQLLHLAWQGWVSLTLPDSIGETAVDLFKCSEPFFELSEDEKARLYPAKSGTEFGFYPVPNEKEYVTYRHRVHTAPEAELSQSSSLVQNVENKVARMWQACALLLFRILCDIARSSQLDLKIWNDILDGTLTMPENDEQMTYSLLRLFKYLPTSGLAEKHDDLGLLTICIGDRGGLEVLDRVKSSNEHPHWIDAGKGPCTATILVGLTLKALSNGTMNSGMHRVVGNPVGRRSVVFALRHSSRHGIDFSLFGGQGRVSARELWKFLQVGRVNINSVKERREAQRAAFAARKSPAADSDLSVSHHE